MRSLLVGKTGNATHLRFLLVSILLLGGIAGAIFFMPEARSLPEVHVLSTVEWGAAEYERYFVDLAENKGALYAYEVLRQVTLPASVSVHSVGHVIGFKLYEEFGVKAMRYCTDEFQGACAHSVLIQLFVDKGPEALREVTDLCLRMPRDSVSFPGCFHGIGHGLMAHLSYNYEEAVGGCRQVYAYAKESGVDVGSRGIWDECVGGATMELLQGEHDLTERTKAQAIYSPPYNIHMPCSAPFLDEEVVPACYTYLTGRFLKAAGASVGVPSPHAYPEALAYCDEISSTNEDVRMACYAGFGADFVYFASQHDKDFGMMTDTQLATVHEWCGFISDTGGSRACTIAALETIFWGGMSQNNVAVRFCGLGNSSTKDACYRTLISYVQHASSSSSERAALCTALPVPYATQCN